MYLKGINYFNGWNRTGAVKWQTQGKDWRAEYPGRIPYWGCFNGKDTMEKEIDVAHEYGVDFFKMLWYVMPDPPREKGVEYLNRCFDDFLACSNNDKLKFCLEFCNHNPFGIFEEDEWQESVKTWVEYMKHPSYLRVNGKPVITFLWVHFFFEHCGNSVETATKRLQFLRDYARQEVGEILLGGGIIMDHIIEHSTGAILHLFDFATSYNSLPEELPNIDLATQERYSYELLSTHVEARRKKLQSTMPIPYVPYLVAGWDPSPWYVSKVGKFFHMPTREQWRNTLQNLKTYLDENPASNVEEGVKMFTIYAWNEYGEGGIMAPCVGDGTMKLEELQRVFCEE